MVDSHELPACEGRCKSQPVSKLYKSLQKGAHPSTAGFPLCGNQNSDQYLNFSNVWTKSNLSFV